ncbi:MAG: antA/AntB antirepressor family protein [Treponema sp.]
MNELIPITEMDGTQLINARDLHGFLQVGRDFSNWIKDRIEKYGFIEYEDFFKHEDLSSPNLASSKARRQKLIDYFLTLDMAKELAMVENNEAGRRIRRYFIRIEKNFRKIMLSGENRELMEQLAELKRDVAELKKGQNKRFSLPPPEDTHSDILRFGGKFLEITGKGADYVEARVLWKLFFSHIMTVSIGSKRFFDELSYVFPEVWLDSSRKNNPVFRGCMIK